MKEELLDKFAQIFGDDRDAQVYFAPGRVNLIGEHTDYNGGHVFPCALTLGTYGVARKRTDRKLCCYSLNFEKAGLVETSLEDLEKKAEGGGAWTNYVKGVIWAFAKKGMKLPCGMDILLYGDIPNGAGLSSSASVEVLTGHILRELFGFCVSNEELAFIGQYAENRYNGVNCGIMDQFAVAMGKKGHAIFLNTSNLEWKYVPVALKDETLVIACSNKQRKLGESKYNERRAECEAALLKLQTVADIQNLGGLNEEQFEALSGVITEEVQVRRARHAVYENQRTLKAAEALQAGDIPLFGELMNLSHDSLREDYEVTGTELDTLVEEARKVEGVLGARMTGAGFGGCTVNLVKKEAVEAFKEQVGKAYLAKIGYAADFYEVEIGGGPVTL